MFVPAARVQELGPPVAQSRGNVKHELLQALIDKQPPIINSGLHIHIDVHIS